MIRGIYITYIEVYNSPAFSIPSAGQIAVLHILTLGWLVQHLDCFDVAHLISHFGALALHFKPKSPPKTHHAYSFTGSSLDLVLCNFYSGCFGSSYFFT